MHGASFQYIVGNIKRALVKKGIVDIDRNDFPNKHRSSGSSSSSLFTPDTSINAAMLTACYWLELESKLDLDQIYRIADEF